MKLTVARYIETGGAEVISDIFYLCLFRLLFSWPQMERVLVVWVDEP